METLKTDDVAYLKNLALSSKLKDYGVEVIKIDGFYHNSRRDNECLPTERPRPTHESLFSFFVDIKHHCSCVKEAKMSSIKHTIYPSYSYETAEITGTYKTFEVAVKRLLEAEFPEEPDSSWSLQQLKDYYEDVHLLESTIYQLAPNLKHAQEDLRYMLLEAANQRGLETEFNASLKRQKALDITIKSHAQELLAELIPQLPQKVSEDQWVLTPKSALRHWADISRSSFELAAVNRLIMKENSFFSPLRRIPSQLLLWSSINELLTEEIQLSEDSATFTREEVYSFEEIHKILTKNDEKDAFSRATVMVKALRGNL